MMSLFPRGSKGRVVIFGAHPDDAEIGAGGTLARLASEGAEVTIVVATVPTHYEARVKEAARGAQVLGAKSEILFDRQTRAEEVPMHVMVQRMDALVGDLRPEMVLVHSQTDLHWDHALVTRAALSALRRTPCNLFAFASSYDLNARARTIGECFVDVTDFMEQKMQSIRAHESQQRGIDLQGARDYAHAMGRKCGATSAEVFEVLRLKL